MNEFEAKEVILDALNKVIREIDHEDPNGLVVVILLDLAALAAVQTLDHEGELAEPGGVERCVRATLGGLSNCLAGHLARRDGVAS